jgi:putative transposase
VVLGQRRVLAGLCRSFGLSRQAYYQHAAKTLRTRFKVTILVQLVCRIRTRQPKIGGKKLHHLLKNDFERLGYKLGRDKFYAVLGSERLLVAPRRRCCKTTDSTHENAVYPNLLAELKLCRPFQAIAADITYIRLVEGFCYLSLVTDLFTHVIVGWCLSESLDAAGSIQALRYARLAMGSVRHGIHHSDQGVQYCSSEYVRLLFRFGMKISMTDTGSPGQNAVAERVNGILKCELLLDVTFKTYRIALPAVGEAIQIYNHERPHYSLGLMTPIQFLRHHRSKR